MDEKKQGEDRTARPGHEPEQDKRWEEREEVMIYDEEEEDEPAPRVWRKVRNVLVTLLILFLFVAGTGIGVGAYVLNSLQPTEPGEELHFTIESGMHSSTIAEELEAQGLIHNAFIFKFYLRFKDQGNRFQAGEYVLEPGMEIDEIIEKFNTGDVYQEPMLKFTIAEGRTFSQITDALSQSGVIDRTVFLNLTSDPAHYEGTLAAQIPAERPYKAMLEGYIFPTTYELPEASTDQEIVAHMFGELERRLADLPSGWEQQLETLGLNFHELLTVASLIEREVVVDEERPLVAGVIYNRLNQSYPLQIDATVQYALDEPKERLLYADLEVDSPYNTYANSGLPPGPIASPGLESIKAALYPETTEYMFYVTKKDGTSEHYFSKTFAEHEANIEKSNENAKKASTSN